MAIVFNLHEQLRQQLKELKWFQHYTKKLEEKFLSSSFRRGMKLKIYLELLDSNEEI